LARFGWAIARVEAAVLRALSAIANEGRTVTVNEVVKKVGFVKNHSETRALVMKIAQREVQTQIGRNKKSNSAENPQGEA
jgi:hypothetical protein